MTVLYRTWDYGTKKNVTVISSEPAAGTRIVTCRDDENPTEAFVLVGSPNTDEAKPGDKAVITFTRGGPRDGYWAYEPVKTACGYCGGDGEVAASSTSYIPCPECGARN